jgi:uncharacterized membrane protein SpoIIM required for sporulation/uncharacterized RDD family membrane protein YckC
MPPKALDYQQHLEIETPEHVVLDLEIAGIGSRALAALIDTLILVGGSIALVFLLTFLAGYGITFGNWGAALIALGWFIAWTGYFVLFEGFRRGQTPGKRFVGVRVVMDTGYPVTFGAAVARNLIRVADFLPPPYLIGALLAAFHPRGKRLGDLVAGTIVARDRPAAAPPSRLPQAPGSPPVSIPELSESEFSLLARFAVRQRDLAPQARSRLAARLVARLGSHPAEPGMPDLEHLLQLHARELARREGRLAAGAIGGSATRFIALKRERWEEFHRLAERAAREGLDSFGSHELPDFAARYREVAADLARARTYAADPGTLAHLERLVAAGHNALYREERNTWRRIWEVLAWECPAAIIQARGYVLIAFLTFAAPASAGFALLRERPELAAELLPDVMLRRAAAGAERKAAGRRYLDVSTQDRPLIASGIITNNVRVAIICFAGGIFLGVGALVLLAMNGLIIGASAGHFANMGLLDYLLEFIVGHGLLELFAIWVAGAAGFLLGRSIVAPGDLSRTDALVVNGRIAIRMVGATAVLLVVAGMIEGFVSAGTGGLELRVAVSAASLLFLVLYLFNGRVGREAGADDGVPARPMGVSTPTTADAAATTARPGG